MSEFKVGDKVIIPDDCSVQAYSKYGTVVSLRGDGRPQVRTPNGKECYGHAYKHYLSTLDTLSVDDVVVNDEGDEYTVASIHDRIVELEGSDGHYFSAYTVKELKDNDWTVKGPGEELTEVTLEEIAKLKGVPVEKLRIKD